MGIKAALAILEEAMDIEQEGHAFYIKAALITEDERGRETFVTLADDEQKHFNIIKKQHDALTHGGSWVSSAYCNPISSLGNLITNIS